MWYFASVNTSLVSLCINFQCLTYIYLHCWNVSDKNNSNHDSSCTCTCYFSTHTIKLSVVTPLKAVTLCLGKYIFSVTLLQFSMFNSHLHCCIVSDKNDCNCDSSCKCTSYFSTHTINLSVVPPLKAQSHVNPHLWVIPFLR